ncbi:hypothetical protein ACFQFC_33215 [Amorphoplanes digitatis]|uniref:SMODS-associating 2TM beta-strand rich effector domain-containing protein n=1 Tax=Actinoplanes digitatis TaxID=1868 RepID=A0A7W7MNG2_9ACTN|nr:hypothetical protein [Actinoplanes digitatis]MBB4761018.1 hypothetical protein [Actinoplanes digitatis]GID95328.1 hypothetical protein Adi01nite_47400 [Actinoplanes digitatis]
MLIALSQEPNWIIVTLVGALVGASVTWWSSPIRYLRARNDHQHLLGTWYEYHYTFRHGQVILGRAAVTIRPGFKNALMAVVVQHETHPDGEVTDLSYAGRVSYEGHLVLSLSGSPHDHTVVMRYLERLPSNTAPMLGMWMSQDHDCLPAAGVSALSRRELTDEQAREVLRFEGSSSGALRAVQTFPR